MIALRKTFLLLLFPMLFTPALIGQNTVEILGERVICAGSCIIYYFEMDQYAEVEWTISGPDWMEIVDPNIYPNEIWLCFYEPGTYVIEVLVFTNFPETFSGQILVEVFDYEEAEIISNASEFCEADSLISGCEKVCEGAIVQYSIFDPGGSGNIVEWQVSGAESYEVDPDGTLQVTWGSAGFGIVQAHVAPDIPGCEKSSTACIEIIEIPSADFTTTPEAINGLITICRGQSIYVDNLTTGSTEYNWQLSNGYSTTEPNPEFDFPDEGSYSLNFIAKNECGCTDSLSLLIEVLEGESPAIDCVGTICENETGEYSTDADCTEFQWSTSSNGTIVDGGGMADNFVTVEWGSGPEGWIFLQTDNCTGDFCNEEAMIRIPIISDQAVIVGPDRVCKASLENYEISDYDATGYFWSVSPGNTIVSGQGSNEISIQWKVNSPLPSFEQVIVEYENCYLNCSGRDTLEVIITDEFFVEGPFEVCSGASSTFRTRKVSNINQGVPSNWEIYGPNNMLYWSSASIIDEINIMWPEDAGLYSVRAIPSVPDDYCNDRYQMVVKLSGIEDPPNDILGEFNICQGNVYEYQASSTSPNNVFTWNISDGGSEYSIQGNPVVVLWNSAGPYSIGVSQTDYTRFPCESGQLLRIPEAINDIQIAGTDETCLEDIGVYNLVPLDYVNIVWSINPSGAGTIISGQGSREVEVQWNSLGNHDVEVNTCGLFNAFSVTVNDLPSPTISAPNSLCKGETAIITTSLAYQQYQWFNENGALLSTAEDPTLAAGHYQLEVTDIRGCKGYQSFAIEEFIEPEINISTPSFTTFCDGPPWPILYALESNPPYDYQWYRNGVPVGGNSSSFSSTDFGVYYVEIVDVNGCTNTSNNIEILKDCGGGGGGNPGCSSGSGSINFDIIGTSECNVFDFQNTSVNFLPGSLNYFFGIPPLGSSLLENPSFSFGEAGFYKVLLLGQVPDDSNPGNYCLSGIVKDLIVPIAADFDFESDCSGEVSSFENRSTYVPGENIVSWMWDFDDPGSGANNNSSLEDPDHIFSTSGNFNVKLTISNGSCSSTKEINVFVPPNSSINFLDPDVKCENAAVLFEANSPELITHWSWDFGDPSSGDANSSTIKDPHHQFSSAGVYPVNLYGTNVYGCTSNMTSNILIEANPLNGVLNYTSPVCEGESVTILSSPGGTAWEWSTGELTEQIVIDEAGVYELTITDDNGCTYSPPPAIVEILPSPVSVIRAVEYDENGQVIATHYDSYSSCFGEDITLEAFGNSEYSFEWSNGTIGNKLEFLEERDNLLTAGTYQFSVEVTNNTTLCTAEYGPFNITVHPNPQDILINSTPSGYLCDGEVVALDVTNPEAGITYTWSNGMDGENIFVDKAGEYTVVGRNVFGCQTQSEEIIIHSAPDIGKIPTGCLVRCKPDTICLPFIPNISSYQWYLDGSPISGPDGQSSELIAQNTGTYYIELTDIFGCSATSESFDVALYDGFGSIYGLVYFDINDNGIVDGPDTLMHNVNFQINDNAGTIINDDSDRDGAFIFLDVLSTQYVVSLDLSSLPPNSSPYQNDLDVTLVGCDDSTQVVFLVHEFCEPLATTTNLEICFGSGLDYNSIYIDHDTSFQITHLSSLGCDSIETVNAVVMNDLFFGIDAEASCPGQGSGSISLDIPSGSFPPYEYSINGQDFYPENYFENLPSGNYTIVVRDANGCSFSGEIVVEEISPFEFTVEDKEIGCSQENVWNTFDLISGDADQINISWSDGSSSDAINISQPGNYWLELSNGCQTVRENFFVSFQEYEFSNLMFVPNIFTPNEDGINDGMQPFIKHEMITQVELFQIFDRWGNILHDSEENGLIWDGKFKGKRVNPGVYVWHIRARVNGCREVKEIYKYGDVTLLR